MVADHRVAPKWLGCYKLALTCNSLVGFRNALDPVIELAVSFRKPLADMYAPRGTVWRSELPASVTLWPCDLTLNSLQVLGICLPTLLVGDYIEGYSLSFVECCEAGLLDCGDVNENVGTSIVRADETKAFLCIEKFHC